MRTVPVSLEWLNGTSLNNTTATSTSLSPLRTSKPCSEGRWYYEITHVSGDGHINFGFGYDYLIDFSFILGANKDVLQKFYLYNYSSIQIFMPSMDEPIKNETIVRELGPYFQGFTMGVAYDTFTNVFSLYNNNSIINVHIKTKGTNKGKVGPIIIEGTSGGDKIFHDNISVNFGQEPFKYPIPSGYQPWNTIWKPSYTYQIHPKNILPLCYILIGLKT